MKLQVKSKDGEILFTNLLGSCQACASTCKSGNEVVNCDGLGEKCRRGVREIDGLSVYFCSNNPDFLESSKRFSFAFFVATSIVESLKDSKNKIAEKVNTDVKRLLHNVTSLNGHNIQEVYSFVPQEILTSDLHNQLRFVKENIVRNPDQAALLFFQIAKNNIAMKTEFSVFRKLYDTNPSLTFRSHPIKKVLMNVFHIFFQDFTDKSVFVKIGYSETRISIDYESVHVALYHIVENASKYIEPNSVLNVDFSADRSDFSIKFDMMSIRIDPLELDEIVKENISGKIAREIKKSGDGMGLYIVNRLLKLNRARLDIYPNANYRGSHMLNGVPYQNNVFEIKFLNQFS